MQLHPGEREFNTHELGGKQEAINYIEKKENITAEIVEYKKPSGLLGIFSSAISQASFYAGKGIGSAFLEKGASSSMKINT